MRAAGALASGQVLGRPGPQIRARAATPLHMVELSRPRLVRVRPGPPPGSHVGEPRYCSYRRCAPRCGTLPGMEPSVGPCSIRSEEHTSELQSLMRISYAVFCL